MFPGTGQQGEVQGRRKRGKEEIHRIKAGHFVHCILLGCAYVLYVSVCYISACDSNLISFVFLVAERMFVGYMTFRSEELSTYDHPGVWGSLEVSAEHRR